PEQVVAAPRSKEVSEVFLSSASAIDSAPLQKILLQLRPSIIKEMFVVRTSANAQPPLSQIDCLLERVR
ncbi:6183_t:CDS:2, partial [Cetraspora pellucida]